LVRTRLSPLIGLAMLVVGCSAESPQATSRANGTSPDALVQAVNKLLSDACSRHLLSTRRNTPWEIVHAALGLGPQAKLRDHVREKEISYLEYFTGDPRYLREPIYLFHGAYVGMRRTGQEGELERHPNQFLAYFAQMGLPKETKFTSEGKSFTLGDMVETARKRFTPGEECTYTLLALATYCKPDESWQNDFGRTYSLTDLVALEIGADRRRLACGGTHSNFALAYAVKHCSQGNVRMETPWREVTERLEQEIKRARELQQADGSFRAQAVIAEEVSDDHYNSIHWKIYSTGHVLEWLSVVLDDHEVESAWVMNAVSFLVLSMNECALNPAPASPWFHAIHALRMWRDRVTGRRIAMPGQSSNEANGCCVDPCGGLAGFCFARAGNSFHRRG
jgi:hypothetical protein